MHTPPSDAVKVVLQVGSTQADAGEPGTMMLGVKLQGAERWRAWGAVALFTLLTIMQDVGTFMPNYLNEKVRTLPCIPDHLADANTSNSHVGLQKQIASKPLSDSHAR